MGTWSVSLDGYRSGDAYFNQKYVAASGRYTYTASAMTDGNSVYLAWSFMDPFGFQNRFAISRSDRVLALPEHIKNASTVYHSLNVKGRVIANSGADETQRFALLALPRAIATNDAEGGWTSARDSEDVYVSSVTPGGEDAYNFTVTDASLIRRILLYGMVLNVVGEKGAYNWGMTYNLAYSSPTMAPIVALDPAVSAFSISDDLPVSWNYSQDAGAAAAQSQIYLSDSADTPESDWRLIHTVSGGATSAVVPASTILPYMPAGVFFVTKYIRVRCTLSGGASTVSAPEPFAFVFPRAEGMHPASGESVLQGASLALTWTMGIGGYGTGTLTNIPDKYDIDYSTNGGETWKALLAQGTLSPSGGRLTHTVSADTFPLGMILWRVRGYVGDTTVPEYSTGVFSVRVQASTSAVSCDGKPKPTLSWETSSQAAYQVRFADYDSGPVFGDTPSHTVPFVYADGLYPVQVRTQSEGGEWSGWTETEYVQITNSSGGTAFPLTATVARHTVGLSWTYTGAVEKYVLYRNGVPIYVGTEDEYTDVTADGVADYYVRAVKSTGYYTQSVTVEGVRAYPANDCIYDSLTGIWLALRWSLAPMVRNFTESQTTYYKHYSGRPKPVSFTDGEKSRSVSVSYALRSAADFDTLRSMVGRAIIYKTTTGSVLIGNLNDLRSASYAKYTAVSFTVTEIDHTEEVPYDNTESQYALLSL